MNLLREAIDAAQVAAGFSSDAEVARALGVTKQRYSDLKAGKHSPTLRTLERLSKVLGVQILIVNPKLVTRAARHK